LLFKAELGIIQKLSNNFLPRHYIKECYPETRANQVTPRTIRATSLLPPQLCNRIGTASKQTFKKKKKCLKYTLNSGRNRIWAEELDFINWFIQNHSAQAPGWLSR